MHSFTYLLVLTLPFSYSGVPHHALKESEAEGDLSSRSLFLKRKISDSNSHPKVLDDLHNLEGCGGEICGTLSGDAIGPLLAGAGECAQQDMADRIIEAAKNQIQDSKVRAEMIKLAIVYRRTERNTFPDFSHQPQIDRNSLYCQKPPQHDELKGLIQTQSSTADPNLFFDPKKTTEGGTLKKGSDPRTIPLGKSTTSSQPETNSQDSNNTTTTTTTTNHTNTTNSNFPDLSSSSSGSQNVTNKVSSDDDEDTSSLTSGSNQSNETAKAEALSDQPYDLSAPPCRPRH